jgi:multidrug resistance efflux pump
MTNAEIHVRAGQCIATLKSRSQRVAQKHRERIKQLRDLAENIEQQTAAGQLELTGEKVSLSPDLERLLGDPIHGL